MAKKHKNKWIVPEGQPLTELDKRVLEFQNKGALVPTRNLIKTPEQIEGIRKAGVINTAALDLAEKHIKEGMTTADRKSTRLNSSHSRVSRMPSSA